MNIPDLAFSVIADLVGVGDGLQYVQIYALRYIEDLAAYSPLGIGRSSVALPQRDLEAGTNFSMVADESADEFQATVGSEADLTLPFFSTRNGPWTLQKNDEVADTVDALFLQELKGSYALRTKVSSPPAEFDNSEWETTEPALLVPVNLFFAGAA